MCVSPSGLQRTSEPTSLWFLHLWPQIFHHQASIMTIQSKTGWRSGFINWRQSLSVKVYTLRQNIKMSSFMLNTSNFLGITITWLNHLFKYMVVCQGLAFLPFLFPSNQSVFSVFSTKSLSATLYSSTVESEGWILVKPLLGRNRPYHA